jgi:hypothetical protein
VDVQIAVDLGLILRCLGALWWGIGLACWLQFSRMGRFMAKERTWISVVVGVGGDLLLGIGADWWVMWLVVALSSVGIIARSLINEHQELEPTLNRYKTKWQMEDTIDVHGDTIRLLEDALEAEGMDSSHANVSRALAKLHKAQRLMERARYGQPEKKK